MLVRLQTVIDVENEVEVESIVTTFSQQLKMAGVGVKSFQADHLPEFVTVHTDGGCDRNKNGVGAWAYVIQYPDGTTLEACESTFETTNNRMELLAVIKALEALEIGMPVKLFSDSEYVVKGTTVWSRNWVRNGWKTIKGDQVINRDLWEELLKLYQLHDVKLEWVKGHDGNELNERCDALCTSAMEAAHKQAILEAQP